MQLQAVDHGQRQSSRRRGGQIKNGHLEDLEVSGPRNLSAPTWREIINSSWKDDKYKRAVMACFIQTVKLLELDRQEKRDGEAALAPKWCGRFKYKVADVLVDKRDGSIFGATLEWDTWAAVSDLIVVRPSKAPRAVVALRGTLLRRPTMWRDINYDLRILAMEDLRVSGRFRATLEAVRGAAKRHGSGNVHMTGYSLGAGLVLQVGCALAEDGLCIEAHLFNPLYMSLSMGFPSLGKVVKVLCKGPVDMARALLPCRRKKDIDDDDDKAKNEEEDARATKLRKWVPHLYVNNRDYLCCYYASKEVALSATTEGKEKVAVAQEAVKNVTAKLYVMSQGPRKFPEAHGLQQWRSQDSELRMALIYL